MVTKTYLPSHLCDSSDSSDSSDTCDISDSSDSSDGSDSRDSSDRKKNFLNNFFLFKSFFYFLFLFFKQKFSQKNSKLKFWLNSKTQIVIKLNSNCDEAQKLKLW